MTIVLWQCSSIYIYQQISNQVNLIVMWSMDVKHICTTLLRRTRTQAQARNQAKDTSHIVKDLWKILIWLTVSNRSNHHILKSSNEDKKSYEGRAPNYGETYTRNTFKHEDSWKKNILSSPRGTWKLANMEDDWTNKLKLKKRRSHEKVNRSTQ